MRNEGERAIIGEELLINGLINCQRLVTQIRSRFFVYANPFSPIDANCRLGVIAKKNVRANFAIEIILFSPLNLPGKDENSLFNCETH